MGKSEVPAKTPWAKWVQAQLKKRKWSIEELCEKADPPIHANDVYRHFRGTNPTVGSRLRIESILGEKFKGLDK